MNLSRILQVVVVIATIGCSCCSAQLACSGSQLDDIVRRVSKTRFEARDTKPKLARCHKFVGLIRGQKELESAGFSTGKPRGQLGEISKILEQRASCPGRPLGGLNSLQEFIDDCQELIELASGAKGPASNESESFRAVDDETKRLRDSLVEQSEAARRLADQNAKLVRESDEQRQLQASEALELKGENAKLLQRLSELQGLQASCSSRNEAEIQKLHGKNDELIEESERLRETNARLSGELFETKAKTAVQAAPGNIREIEVKEDERGRMGITWETDVYGSVFVAKIMAGSPAARAGLRFGDQLIQLDGRPTAGQDMVKLASGKTIKFLVRKSPMEQTFVVKPRPGEGPGFSWSKDNQVVQKLMEDKAAARAGVLEGFRLITVNGESVIGLNGAALTGPSWWPEDEFTLTLIPQDFFQKVTYGMDLDEIRIENNKILADEKAGRY